MRLLLHEMNGVTVFAVLCLVECARLPIVEASLCEGEWEAEDSLLFAIPPGLSDILRNASCYGQLISDGKVRVQYWHGGMEDFTEPVKRASVDSFTLGACRSAYIHAECPEYKIFRNVTCYCQSRRSTYASRTSPTSPFTSNKVEVPANLQMVRQDRHYIFSVAAIAVFTLTISIVIISLRRRRVFSAGGGHSNIPGSSAASSTDHQIV